MSVLNIIIALLALSFIILVHELGHFTAARIANIKVHEFAIFMGPKIFSIKKGETIYSIRAIPIGGFVHLEGEEESSEDKRALCNKPKWIRAIVMAAGSLTNIVLAVIILTILFLTSGYTTNEVGNLSEDTYAYEAGLREGDVIKKYNEKNVYHPIDIDLFMYITKGEPVDITVKRDGEMKTFTVKPEIIPEQSYYLIGFTPAATSGEDSNLVENVLEESNAKEGGLRAGDRIIKLNDTVIDERSSISEFMETNGGKEVDVTVLRDSKEVVLKIAPYLKTYDEMYYPGFDFKGRNEGLFNSIGASITYAYSIIRSVYLTIGWLITGQVSIKDMMGPVGIVSTIGTAVKQPTLKLVLLNLFNIMAFISINLGVVNLIPFPALDGSKLLLILIEALRRKKIPVEKEAFIAFVGFIILIAFMLYTVFNDVVRIRGG